MGSPLLQRDGVRNRTEQSSGFTCAFGRGGVNILVSYSPTQFPLPLLDQITTTTLISLVSIEVSGEFERTFKCQKKEKVFILRLENEAAVS